MAQINIAEYQEDTPQRTSHLRVWLWLLDALVVGGLITFFITAQFINEVTDAYAIRNQLAQTTAFSMLLDELYPYHLGYLIGAQLLLALTVIVELWSRLRLWKLRHDVHPLTNN